MTLCIKNAVVVNPADSSKRREDIFVRGDVVAEISNHVTQKAGRVIDASGLYCMPGFIDMHTHLRDPGQTEKEDMASATAAALAGGFTTLVAMPNTDPVADCPEAIEYVRKKAEETSRVRVLPVGSVTRGMRGEELSDIRGMARAGCICISEDGKSVMNASLYREAMRIAAGEDMTVLAHCEDSNLAGGGVLNADAAKRLGVPGITNAAEDVIAARDILLAKETGARLHLCHCSTRDSVEMARLAKADGVNVSAEVCPHHFSLSSDEIRGDDANYKMNPPLRAREDVEALRRGLSEDVFDVIATDHAPHTSREKERDILQAPFGIVGLETAAALAYTHLVKPGLLTIARMAEKMSGNPARILGVDGGVIEVGARADLVLFDPNAAWTVDPGAFLSKGRNTPFAGKKLFGRVRATIAGGEVSFECGGQ